MIATHVLIGKAKPIATKSGFSGIDKQPYHGKINVGLYGLAGDTICDTKHHGGLTQAVYIMGSDDYTYWEQALARALPVGQFGENLIITDLDTHHIHIGDQFILGDVILTVTAPRIPCVTLGVHMQDKTFPKQFLRSGHTGVYCSVSKTGSIHAGIDVIWEKNTTPQARLVVQDLKGWESKMQ